jgi:hypothetical protein
MTRRVLAATIDHESYGWRAPEHWARHLAHINSAVKDCRYRTVFITRFARVAPQLPEAFEGDLDAFELYPGGCDGAGRGSGELRVLRL